MGNSVWYSGQQLLSYNRPLSCCVGARTGGKSFYFQKLAVDHFLEKKRMSVFLYRYDTDIETPEIQFKHLQSAGYFNHHEFTAKGNKLYISDMHFGYVLALSRTQKYKSRIDFSLVDYVIFDEFIILPGCGRYIKGEYKIFQEMYGTIARTRPNVRAIFIANNVDLDVPYFHEWKIYPSGEKEFQKNKQIVLQTYVNESHIEMMKKTSFGKMIAGSSYAEYAIFNKRLHGDDSFIKAKPPNAKFFCNVFMDGKKWGFWEADYSLFMCRNIEPSSAKAIALDVESHNEGTMFIKNSKEMFFTEIIVSAFKAGRLFFSDRGCKGAFMEIFGMFGRR